MTKYLGNRSSTLYGPPYNAFKDLRILSVRNQTCEQEFESNNFKLIAKAGLDKQSATMLSCPLI